MIKIYHALSENAKFPEGYTYIGDINSKDLSDAFKRSTGPLWYELPGVRLEKPGHKRSTKIGDVLVMNGEVFKVLVSDVRFERLGFVPRTWIQRYLPIGILVIVFGISAYLVDAGVENKTPEDIRASKYLQWIGGCSLAIGIAIVIRTIMIKIKQFKTKLKKK